MNLSFRFQKSEFTRLVWTVFCPIKILDFGGVSVLFKSGKSTLIASSM